MVSPCPFDTQTTVFGHPCEYWTKLESTNIRLKELAANGAPEGAVVCAAYQTAGRGQRAADWFAPAGENMLLSLLCRPPLSPAEMLKMTLAAALCVKKALLSFEPTRSVGEKVRFKWPNDVMADGLKLAGILLESSLNGNHPESLIIGVGLNLNSRFDTLKARGLNAVSCRMLTGKEINPLRFTAHFIEIFETCYFEWIKNKLTDVPSDWIKYSLHRNRSLTIDQAHGRINGMFAGLSQEGLLLIKDKMGGIRKIFSGKVVEF